MKKKITIVCVIIAILATLILTFLAISKLVFPKIVVKNMFTYLQNGEFDKVGDVVNYSDLMSSETTDQQNLYETSEENEALKKSIFSSMQYEIIGSGIEKGNSYVDVNVTNKNIEDVFKKYLSKFISVAFSIGFDENNTQNLENTMNEYLSQLFNSEEIETITTKVRIYVKLEGFKHKVQVDENLKNAIFPGFEFENDLNEKEVG